ncbi:MAG TPA: hypothetical protein VF463_19220 [Sphingobium sp.]
MDQITWITPVEAGRLVASYLGSRSVSSGETQVQILEWIWNGKVRTMALEVTKREDLPPATMSAKQERPETSRPIESDELPVTYRVNSAYRPSIPENELLLESELTDYVMTVQDWQDSWDAGTLVGRFWSSAELGHPLRNQRHPLASVAYAGIRLAKQDIERRIAIAGWPSIVNTNAETNADGPGPRHADLEIGEPATVTSPTTASDAAIRRAVKEYLAAIPDPVPPLKDQAAAIRRSLSAPASRDRIITIIKELSGTLRPGPRGRDD